MRRIVVLAALALSSLLIAATATATVPAGPRLAFVRWSTKPMALELLGVGVNGRQLRRIAGGPVGKKKATTGAPVPFQQPSFSLDGSLLAFAGYVGKRGRAIFLVAPDGNGLRQVPGTDDATDPVLSPDGRTLAFARFREHNPHINVRNPIGSLLHGKSYESTTSWLLDLQSGQQRRLTPWRNGLDIEPSSFSPDGALLGVSKSFRGNNEVAAVNLTSGASVVLARHAQHPVYSPDGSRIAFISYRDRNVAHSPEEPHLVSELYTMRTDGSHLRRLTHTRYREESSPSWDPSGQRLAYTQITAPEPLPFGFTNVVMEINADGSCPTRVIGHPHVGRFPKLDGPGLFGPVWQPGPGREAGRIECGR